MTICSSDNNNNSNDQTDTLIKQSKCSGSLPRHFLSPLIKAYRNTLTYYTNLVEQCNCYPSINTISYMIGGFTAEFQD